MNKALRLAAFLLLIATSFVARGQSEVSYSDDFQSYGTQANPPGWIDTSVGQPRPEAHGLYKTWPDPVDKKSPNIVYGTKQSSGSPEGNNPRIGTFSTLSTRTFAGKGRFEYRGRIWRGDDKGRIGLTLFSSYPEIDSYYLIGLWSQAGSANLTMQLFAFGAGTITGTRDSNITLDPNKWYRFVIQADDADDQTKIRAKFWPETDPEPAAFAIDAIDAAPSRLESGRIGFWSAVKGDSYIDDIAAKSPVDHTAPTIVIRESGQVLADGTKFNRTATPEIVVTDDLSTFTVTADLDGAPFTSGTAVSAEGWHTLKAHAVDGPGNIADVQVRFLVDKTPPVVTILEGATPFPPSFFFNRNVVANANVTDATQTTVSASLDGASYTLGTPITSEGAHSISVTAVDEVGWSTTAGPIAFTIDKTPPALTFTSHANNAVLTAAHAILIGGSDDAVTVLVNGTAATVDANAKTFTSSDLALLEGENTITAAGTDRAGNVGTATIKLIVDTRAPELAITAPNADACVDGTSVSVSGTAADPRIATVKVTIGSQSVNATLAAGGAWSASIPVATEGHLLITVEAADQSGHTTSSSRSINVDRTAPSIEVLQSGVPFTATVTNRPVTLFLRATDADPNVTVTGTLDGHAYTSGTAITAEGAHTLVVSASDCAAHNAQKTVAFTIDLTPPTIRNLDPANGGTVGTMPNAIRGVTDADVAAVIVDGTQLSATPDAAGAFTIHGVAFAEGTNRFHLTATDRAGNSGALDYAVTVQTLTPAVEIRESGLPIVDGTVYTRAVTPVVHANDQQATITATLNGNNYVSGTTISADGDYTIAATATDAFNHSGSAQAHFTIDRTPPVVTITAPADGATVRADHVEVRGNAGDSVSATLNGLPLTLAADGSFILDVPLDPGANPIGVTGRDRAGNSARATTVVTRDDLGAGILITYPPDHALTNRATTDVVGRLLSPNRGTTVTIGGPAAPVAVEVDATGGFRVTGYALTEGENGITATATAANGVQTSASTHVTADFTPPSLTILESGQPLADNVRFATQAVLSLQASDSAGSVTTTFAIDGNATAAPSTVSAAGGHSVIATARDLAGNEARAERTLFIGAAGGGASCGLEGFDPADGAVVLANSITLIGRSGGAIGVKVNGIAAVVADGAFVATVELPNEGPNVVSIQCTDANGAPTGTPATITLRRVTGNPSIAITAPDENFVTASETVNVTGTVGSSVVSADVNGVAATISGGTFSAANVHLAEGLNVLTAHGKDAAGHVASTSRRVYLQKNAPAVAISAPLPNTATGSSHVDVTGTWANLDPSTLSIRNLANNQVFSVTADAYSNTTGSFRATSVSLTSGEQTLRVTGRARLNRTATADVVITLTAGAPSIVIAAPLDHATFDGSREDVDVSGSFTAAAGSTVDVNGVAATITGTSYSATVKFSTLVGGLTPIVARVTEPGGASAAASVLVTQTSAAPKVVEAFPAPNAAEVDPGALLLVLFSQPMDGATIPGAFRLEDASGNSVTGTLWLDKDVLTFAPAALLANGGTYTLEVATSAKNLAGTALESAFASSFTVASTAPRTPPSVTPITNAVCGQSITVAGTASPSARVRLTSGALVLNTAADASGRFSFTYPISGQSGFALIRIQTVGSDGSVSPAAELNVRVDCSGPSVLNAAYDRNVNTLTIQFSEDVDPSTVSGAIVLTADGANVGSAASTSGAIVTVTPSSDLRAKSFTLSVTTQIEDTIGNHLVTPYTQDFTLGSEQPASGNGTGFISGEVYDATTGRPLPGASVAIDVGSSAVSTITDARGRYLARLPEGAHTIEASLAGYTTVWRQIIVPAGAGVIPIDIRLTKRGTGLTHGGDTAITRPAELSAINGGQAPPPVVTSVGAQALPGLLPLGWSPIAAAEVTGTFSSATLTFTVPRADVIAAAQNLTAVQYDSARDEWRVLESVANIGSDGKASFAIAGGGAFALVYADKSPLTAPPLPVTGDVLQGVPAASPDAPAMIDRGFTLDPAIVLPSGRTVATLRIEGAGEAKYPSGTAVQAYIDEDLRLADGSRLLDPPFATDLLLYRNLAGDLGIADFHLAPSAKAAQVVLDIGFDHIRILPYPGRLDRGTLIGSEGGRVPADDKVAVEIPSGAVPEPLRATATSLTQSDLDAFGSIAGFRIVGGFQLTLQRATEPAPQDLDENGVPDTVAPPELFIPARATYAVDASKLPGRGAQVVLAEVLGDTPYGIMLRLAAPMMAVDATSTSTTAMRFTTKTIDRSVLPVDGVAHEGRYLVLAAESAVAFATGTVHLGATNGRLLENVRVLAPPLGLGELSRSTGIYNIVVPATTFTLVPRHTSTGDGASYTHPTAVATDSVTRVDLALVAQPPTLGTVVVLRGDPPSQGTLGATLTTDVALTTNIRASFSPNIDPSSVTDDSITVVDAATGRKMPGRATADSSVAVVWTLTAGERLKPNTHYLVTIAPSLRGLNGATIARGATYSFVTVTQLVNTEIHRERIRITIPDANGHSRITGDAGALPAGWQAVAIRRNVDFFVRYQATAASNGSFTFALGNDDPRDAISMGDLIDLQVINNNGALAGIYALTPFVTEDGKGFVAPPTVEVKFTSPDGIGVTVPAGAFDVPTIVTVQAAQKEDFLDIPRIEEENEYATSIDIEFEGFAKKPLDVEAAVPAGFDTTGKDFLLAWKGESLRGPRLAVMDLVRVANGKFTTVADEASNSRRIAVTGMKPGSDRTLTGKDFRDYLLRLIRGGRYTVLDIKQPVGGAVGWAVMEGLQANYDLMWDTFWSYYDPYVYVFERPARVIPVITGKPFTVTGVDTSTGLAAFSRTYDPIPVGDPYAPVFVPSPQQNDGGPYPVFGGPFRVETLDLDVEDIDIKSVRNFTVRLSNGSVSVMPGDEPLGSDVRVELMNISSGGFTSGSATSSLSLSAKVGQRIVLAIETRDVDPAVPVSVVFNEPIYTGNDATADAVDVFLHDQLKVEQAPDLGGSPAWVDITPHARFTIDSGGRRLNVTLPSALQREAVYRVTLKSSLADITTDGAGLKLGQGTVAASNGDLSPVGGNNDIHLTFHIRKPAGQLGQFTVADSGVLRDMDLYGNMLFTASIDGGLRAFDISNPAAIDGYAPLLARVGPPDVVTKTMAVRVDHHGRVFTTAENSIVGVFRSYRAEDFANGSVTPGSAKASTIINWQLGYSSMIGLPSNTILSDRPESIPYHLRVILQDDTKNYPYRKKFVDATGASETGDYPGQDLKSYDVTLQFESQNYKYERITIENVSLDMRWSADASVDGPAIFHNVLARSTDRLRVLRNKATYAAVAHLGYGIAVYDVNAMESNRHPSTTAATKAREQLFLGNGIVGRECNLNPPIWAIGENYLNLDVEMRGDENGDVFVYAPHSSKGVLDYRIHLPLSEGDAGSNDSSCDQRGLTGLVIKSFPDGNEFPRIAALRSAIPGQAYPHFNSVAQYHWSISAADNQKGLRGTIPGMAAERDYLLVAAMDYGVIVVDMTTRPQTGPEFPLSNEQIADVLWVPGGAAGVRVVQEANIAVVTDREGRAVLIDLSRIDERWDANGDPVSGLFPTAAKAIAGPSSGNSIGSDDPRILWKSEPGTTSGAMPPLYDPSTGMIYGASMTGRTIKVLSAVDPTVHMKVNVGEDVGLSEVGGVVPLGVAPPQHIQDFIDDLPACDGAESAQCKENASLAAFKLEVSLPGGMLDSLGNSNNELWVAVESERVAGAVTEQTPNGFPRAHLRRRRRDGSSEPSNRAATNFKLTRVVPPGLEYALKLQRGYNKFVSPWIIAIADPRASEQYQWNGATADQKEDAGCFSCERPKYLQGLDESDGVYELWTNGRFISVRPEFGSTDTIFTGTQYSYLGDQNRLGTRFTTIMADTVRPTEVVVAAQNPPAATGHLQQTTYLHSGELETSNVDLNAGGRTGFDVMFERTYRSRTLGGTVLGQGWDSSMFRRLRPLPSGDVEYRDGSEVWTFVANASTGGYERPAGLFLRLARTARGYKLIDQNWRITEFDDMGRLLAESDEFYDPAVPDSGNTIRYVYDDTGRLSYIVDPVNRVSRFLYWKESEAGTAGAYPGLVKEITDWRDRKTDYEYDETHGTLTTVRLPEVANITGGRPALRYAYTPAGSGYNDSIELSTNLESITDPNEVATGGGPRVKFVYDTGSGFKRDRVTTQQWGTGETATFTYNSATSVDTKDVLNQTRTYTLTAQPKSYFEDRAHVEKLVENGLSISSTPFGQLPQTIAAAIPATSSADRTLSFSYNDEGMVKNATLNGVRTSTYGYQSVEPAAPGFVPSSTQITPLAGPPDPVTEGTTYQSGANLGTFVASVTANGKKIDLPEPSRYNKDTNASNDAINETDSYDKSGQLQTIAASGGTDSAGGGEDTKIEYAPKDDSALYRRAQIIRVTNGGLETKIEYPSADTSIQHDPRGVVTTIESDSWQRPIHVTVVGPDQSSDDRFEYDATGRVRKQIRRQGATNVTTTYTYDVMGRTKSETVDDVADVGTATTNIDYDLPGRTVITHLASGATTTEKLDGLGRTVSRETTTGGPSPVADYFAYDLAGNLVFSTDLFTAAAAAYDAHGRMAGMMATDGTKTMSTFDAWGRTSTIQDLDAAGNSLGLSTFQYTDAGALQSVSAQVDASRTRVMNFVWDGAGRMTGSSDSGRASHARYDSAGRLLSAEQGAGDASSVSNPFSRSTVGSHDGRLPQQIQKSEKGSSSYALALQYNTAGDAIAEDLGNLGWRQSFDQAGNLTSAQAPNRAPYGFEYDSQGQLKRADLPGGGSNQFNYHVTGSLAGFKDPADEVTTTTNDLLGRPTLRSYKDGTQEKIEWEGRHVKSITDRQGRVQVFHYNGKAQIDQITSGSGGVLDTIEYDDGGRVKRWTTPDSVIELGDYDYEGRPGWTSQARYSNGTLIDKYKQVHTWTLHGERSSWTMPTYDGFTSPNGWTKSIDQKFDDMGNLIQIDRTLNAGSGGLMMQADYRGEGRPDRRVVTTPAGEQITREYGYDSANGFINRMAVLVAGRIVGGTAVMYDGLQKASGQLLGVSGGARVNEWSYDERSRLDGSSLARDGESTPDTEDVSAADFRGGVSRTQSTPADPPSITIQEDTSGGHKISFVQRGSVVEQFHFNGGERSEDGRFVYEYDAKGRLAIATTKLPLGSLHLPRRVKYFYDGNDRMIGRRLEYVPFIGSGTPSASDWKLEDRANILAGEGLPADATFVWDPIDDQLVAIFKAGASENPSIDPNGGLVRQIIHGGAGYDDPIEVTTVDPAQPGAIGRLYPVYDEAGAKSLQVILNDQGRIVSRTVAGGPYGEDPAILTGPAVDRVSVSATKDEDGNLVGVDVTLRATEQLSEPSMAAGLRLAIVDAAGNVVRTSSVAATLADEATARWTLTAAQWTALAGDGTGSGTALSVAVTNSLRAQAWSGSAPFLRAPAWATQTKPVYTTAELRIEVRESLANLSQWLASIPAGATKANNLFDVPSLVALGTPRVFGEEGFIPDDAELLIVSAGFHAQPFQDPFTGKNYGRARWFDPQTGTWLTPDPRSYSDSPNLYAYCGNDPVNCTDPTGEISWEEAWAFTKGAAKTLAVGVAITAVGAGAVALGVCSAPFVVTVGIVVAVGAAANAAINRYADGHATSVTQAIGMGIADVTGVTAGYEAYTGREVGTGRSLSRVERAERWGTVAGTVATIAMGPKVVKASSKGAVAAKARFLEARASKPPALPAAPSTGPPPPEPPPPSRVFYAGEEGTAIAPAELPTNAAGGKVVVPDGHVLNSLDPALADPAIVRSGPFTNAQRAGMLKGNAGRTRLAPHHRHQLPVKYGGIIDEIPGKGHALGQQHLVPGRHPSSSIFNAMKGTMGRALRAREIYAHWRAKGLRLVEVAPGEWMDPLGNTWP